MFTSFPAMKVTPNPLLSQPPVAILIESDGPGGAERMVAMLATTLQEAGHPVLVILPAKGEGWLAEQLRHTRVSIEHFRLPRPVSFGTARQITNMIRTFGARTVHSHEFSMAVYGAVAAMRARVPHVVTMHGSRYYAERLRRRVAMRWAARRSVLVAVSATMADHLSRDLGIEPGAVHVIANGVHLAPGRPDRVRAELRLDAAATLLLAVGSLYPVKGHSYLLEALARLSERHGAVHLAIAGRGNELGALQAQAASLGISDRVHFLGLRSDVPDLLAAADLFVHPSLSEELPVAVLEAMAAFRPVIATAVGDVPKALDQGQAGVLVPSEDAAALARAIDDLLDDPERALLLGKRAHTRATEWYGLSGMVASYQDIYARLTTPGSPADR